MRRQRWFEIHDSRWFPGRLRDLVTEGLEAVWELNHTYRPIAGRLREALRRCGTEQVVDLCSGGGGPWRGLYPMVAGGGAPRVRLTDRYPNARLLERADGSRGEVQAYAEPVDARQVPAELRGFRTIFSALHHFDPEEARAMLADAWERGEGIGVFEAARPKLKTILLVTGVPVLALQAAVRVRPFRWELFFWSWVVPVVPAVLWIDGVLSCLRSYSEADMRELTAGLDGRGYRWEVGCDRGGLVEIQYLIGTPVAKAK
jgi:hypothetical protein